MRFEWRLGGTRGCHRSTHRGVAEIFFSSVTMTRVFRLVLGCHTNPQGARDGGVAGCFRGVGLGHRGRLLH